MMQITFNGLVGCDEIYEDCLNAIIGTKRNSFCDLGANKSPHAPKLGFKERKYIDILPRILDFPEEQQYFEQMDILNLPLDKHYDVTMAMDVCEHLTLENGYKLLTIMEAISDTRILFTPLGALWMKEHSDNPEDHISAWYPEMVQNYASIVFPDYHKGWGVGAFFFFNTDNLKQDFNRVKKELKAKSWAKLSK